VSVGGLKVTSEVWPNALHDYRVPGYAPLFSNAGNEKVFPRAHRRAGLNTCMVGIEARGSAVVQPVSMLNLLLLKYNCPSFARDTALLKRRSGELRRAVVVSRDHEIMRAARTTQNADPLESDPSSMTRAFQAQDQRWVIDHPPPHASATSCFAQPAERTGRRRR
jgi:hypothetical protein